MDESDELYYVAKSAQSAVSTYNVKRSFVTHLRGRKKHLIYRMHVALLGIFIAKIRMAVDSNDESVNNTLTMEAFQRIIAPHPDLVKMFSK